MVFVGKRGWFFLVSGLLILPGVISLLIPPPLTPGIDFTSGSALEVTFVRGTDVNEDAVRDVLDDHGHSEALIQKTGGRSVFIRTDVLEPQVEGPEGAVSSEQAVIERDLEDRIGLIESRDFDTVSAIVAEEMVRNAIIAVLFAAVGILVYVTWAFRNIPNSFRYGVSAILALVHDMLLIVGIFSILGKALNVEVNSMFIVGLLTVLGYSVNDTIVVFDRIRENVARNPDRPFPGLVNLSIMETIGRSLNTSLTTLFVLLALLLFGGSTIRPFLLVLIIGVVVGTYSSAAIASQFLVIWERGELRRALGYLPFVRRAPARSG
ncbi:MAG: protein translocase subunit SecF [Dehalococcoidia bacterium]|nr:protein translocase subunit SecF [Dehalococcoidia bacterium]